MVEMINITYECKECKYPCKVISNTTYHYYKFGTVNVPFICPYEIKDCKFVEIVSIRYSQ